MSENSPPPLITPLVLTLSPGPNLSSSYWQEVSSRPIPGSPRREPLSTSNTDSLNTEGSTVAREVRRNHSTRN
ncbi:hypothetical protein PBY51_011818 [Eleginops maclovinus]|uniref:Uncharacterized protein n=1 Tax=Eleginops maclovinus TaxID=56733 RepID=A0AAN8AST0_ELEMC|nr:hypothetical protein PBY51_011818 [Eleginops maclovinus]